jgi:hypothetical protein
LRYRLVTVIGAALFLASLVGFCLALTSVLDAGTCASGNSAFEISKPCPDGTTGKVWLLTLSILGVILSGGTFAARGYSPGGDDADTGSFLAGWATFFTTAGTVSLIHSLTSDTIPADGKLGGTIVGALFLLFGVPTFAYLAWKFSRRE